MSIIDFLCEHVSRVEFENRWLVVNEDTDGEDIVYRFIVFEQEYRRKLKVIYNGFEECDATYALENGVMKNEST